MAPCRQDYLYRGRNQICLHFYLRTQSVIDTDILQDTSNWESLKPLVGGGSTAYHVLTFQINTEINYVLNSLFKWTNCVRVSSSWPRWWATVKSRGIRAGSDLRADHPDGIATLSPGLCNSHLCLLVVLGVCKWVCVLRERMCLGVERERERELLLPSLWCPNEAPHCPQIPTD